MKTTFKADILEIIYWVSLGYFISSLMYLTIDSLDSDVIKRGAFASFAIIVVVLVINGIKANRSQRNHAK